jgi:hypothetical protein
MLSPGRLGLDMSMLAGAMIKRFVFFARRF